MSWTKQAIIDQAFDKIGLGPYAYQKQPEDYQSALRDLDAMMAHWDGLGAHVGYNGSTNAAPNSTGLDSDSGIGAQFVLAVYSALAVQISTGYGKTVAPDVRIAANNGLKKAQSANSAPPTKKRNTMAAPAGAGHKSRGGYPVNLTTE